MIDLPLTFFERISLWNLCGNHQVQLLKDASIYLRLIEKFRPTDGERRDTQFTPSPDGRLAWKLPHDNYGNRVIQIEGDEAKALKQAMEAVPVRVADAEWMLRITSVLEEVCPPQELVAKE